MEESIDKTLVRNIFERVVIMTLIAAFLALSVISIVNDMYSFVKPDKEVQITLDGKRDIKHISRLLQKEGIIKNPTIFSMFVRSKDRVQQLESFVGEVILQSNMSYREIMLALS